MAFSVSSLLRRPKSQGNARASSPNARPVSQDASRGRLPSTGQGMHETTHPRSAHVAWDAQAGLLPLPTKVHSILRNLRKEAKITDIEVDYEDGSPTRGRKSPSKAVASSPQVVSFSMYLQHAKSGQALVAGMEQETTARSPISDGRGVMLLRREVVGGKTGASMHAGGKGTDHKALFGAGTFDSEPWKHPKFGIDCGIDFEISPGRKTPTSPTSLHEYSLSPDSPAARRKKPLHEVGLNKKSSSCPTLASGNAGIGSPSPQSRSQPSSPQHASRSTVRKSAERLSRHVATEIHILDKRANAAQA